MLCSCYIMGKWLHSICLYYYVIVRLFMLWGYLHLQQFSPHCESAVNMSNVLLWWYLSVKTLYVSVLFTVLCKGRSCANRGALQANAAHWWTGDSFNGEAGKEMSGSRATDSLSQLSTFGKRRDYSAARRKVGSLWEWFDGFRRW